MTNEPGSSSADVGALPSDQGGRSGIPAWVWILISVGAFVAGVAVAGALVGDGDDSNDIADPATADVSSTATAPTTTMSVVQAGFFEDFSGAMSLDRLDTGVFHRDEILVDDTEWIGDHDLGCGPPETGRTIVRDDERETHYLCREHLMTSVGDTSGYSVGWFSPREVFEPGSVTRVAWDVNVTDLGERQWIEVKLMPADAPIEVAHRDIAGTAELPEYPSDSLVFTSVFDARFIVNDNHDDQLQLTYGGPGELQDAEGRASKAIRRPHEMIDNGDGTITLRIEDGRGVQTFVAEGSYPSVPWKVVFADHNYTPNKACDGLCVGYTWHWDNISIS